MPLPEFRADAPTWYRLNQGEDISTGINDANQHVGLSSTKAKASALPVCHAPHVFVTRVIGRYEGNAIESRSTPDQVPVAAGPCFRQIGRFFTVNFMKINPEDERRATCALNRQPSLE